MINKVLIVLLGDFYYDARTYNMANTLVSQKYIVNIVHCGTNVASSINNKLKIKNISLGYKGALKYLEWNFKLFNYIKTKHYQKIICADLYSLPAVCCLGKKYKIIYDSREIFSELAAHKKSTFKKKINKYIEKKCLSFVSSVITSAPSDEKHLKQIYPDNNHINFYVIYNYAHIYLDEDFKLRKKLKINLKSKIFLYQGVVQKDRGIGLLFRLITKIDNAVAVIVGNGEHEVYYKKKYQHLSIQKKIFFINRVPYTKLLSITKEADVGCLFIKPVSLSNTLALPNKLFEYALCGIPSLASHLPNVDYFIKKYNLGKTVNINSMQEIVSGANALLKEDNQKKIKEAALKHCSWSSQDEQFICCVENE